MDCKVLLISGKLGSGKDTFGEYLIKECERRKLRVTRMTFAKYFKDCLQHVFLLESGWFYDREKKEEKIPNFEVSPREMMIRFSDFVRACKPTLFVDVIRDEIRVLQQCGEAGFNLIVVTDARMQKEFEMLTGFNPISILVKRDTGIVSVADTHESETYIDSIPEDQWSFVINNNGSLSDLEIKAIEVVNYIESRYIPPYHQRR